MTKKTSTAAEAETSPSAHRLAFVNPLCAGGGGSLYGLKIQTLSSALLCGRGKRQTESFAKIAPAFSSSAARLAAACLLMAGRSASLISQSQRM